MSETIRLAPRNANLRRLGLGDLIDPNTGNYKIPFCIYWTG